jgi:septum formation protein
MPEVILASGSPRRKELISSLGWKFNVVVPEIDEIIGDELPREAAERLAREKGSSVAAAFTDSLVIAADTIVVIEDRVLGKPESPEEALTMLQLLNNRTHEVITGLCLCYKDRISVSSETTRVSFRNMELPELEAYIATGEGEDKAGAYAIQGKGALLVERIEGCYFNVVGLPLHRMSIMLQNMGIDLALQWR